MKNRDSAHPGRIKLTPVDEVNGIYDLTRADEPREVGTPLNKKLLDFAVAACGVTAGTATEYTLDDEFGGFELVDGAKVSFGLHVASGVNPTLNVNGTGAKRLINAVGNPFPAAIPAGAWVNASYSHQHDAYLLVGFDAAKWITKVESASKAVQLTLPDGYNIFRLSATFTTDDTYTGVDYATDVPFTGSAVGAECGSAQNDYPDKVYTSVSNGNYIATGTSGKQSFVDMMIYRGNGTTVQGTSGGGRVVAFNNSSSSNLRVITVKPDSEYNNIVSGTIILEGIA